LDTIFGRDTLMNKKTICTACVSLLILSLTLSMFRADAFHISTHRRITLDALYRGGVRYNGVPMSFSIDAVDAIDFEAAGLDRGAALGIDLTEPYRHFDNESFEKGSEYVIDMKNKVISRLSKDNMDDFDLKAARTYFAYGMHAVQDFYSHSNWIELGHHEICPTLGVGPFQVPLASQSESTCTDKYKLSGAGLTKLTSGYWPGLTGCSIPFANKCHHGKSGCSEGIAKDPEGDPDFKPGNPENPGKHDPDGKLHAEAVRLATLATKAYAELILSDPGVQKHCKNVARFMGVTK
jgi:hypothetical protein